MFKSCFSTLYLMGSWLSRVHGGKQDWNIALIKFWQSLFLTVGYFNLPELLGSLSSCTPFEHEPNCCTQYFIKSWVFTVKQFRFSCVELEPQPVLWRYKWPAWFDIKHETAQSGAITAAMWMSVIQKPPTVKRWQVDQAWELGSQPKPLIAQLSWLCGLLLLMY